MQMVIEVSVVGSGKFGRLLWTCTIWNTNMNMSSPSIRIWAGLKPHLQMETWPELFIMDWQPIDCILAAWPLLEHEDIESLNIDIPLEQIGFSKNSLHCCYAQERGQGWLRRTLVSLVCNKEVVAMQPVDVQLVYALSMVNKGRNTYYAPYTPSPPDIN